MKPEDDYSWPSCPVHSDRSLHFCDWVSLYFDEGSDASSLVPGSTFSVPVVPRMDLYAEIGIAEEIIPNQCYQLKLFISGQLAAQSTDVILGVWAVGEGRASIRSVLIDWCDTAQVANCEYFRHGFGEEMKWQNRASLLSGNQLADYELAYKWCMATLSCCYECYNNSGNTAAVVWDATSYGLDPGAGVATRARAFGKASTQADVRQSLKNRYT